MGWFKFQDKIVSKNVSWSTKHNTLTGNLWRLTKYCSHNFTASQGPWEQCHLHDYNCC